MQGNKKIRKYSPKFEYEERSRCSHNIIFFYNSKSEIIFYHAPIRAISTPKPANLSETPKVYYIRYTIKLLNPFTSNQHAN